MTDSSARTFAIVGNGIAGTSAAEIIRKNDPNARIVLIAAEPYPLYNRIALPPFLKRKVAQQKVLIRDLAGLDAGDRSCPETAVDSLVAGSASSTNAASRIPPGVR